MCEVYSSAKPERYECTTRSVRLHGLVTSVRLENEFWDILEALAADQGYSVPHFIAELYDEVSAKRGRVSNLASILRVACAVYLTRKIPRESGHSTAQGVRAGSTPG